MAGAARTSRGKVGSRRTQVLSNRNTALLVAALCAVAAGVLIYLFVSHYSKSTTTAPPEVTVYKAKRYIAPGTPQALVAQEGLLVPAQIPSTAAVVGAINDPSEISGEVTSAPISAGQQVTLTDFSHANVTISSYLKGDERAIAFPLDSSHGLTAYLGQGDTVDIMGLNGGSSEMLAQNVTVLENSGGNVVLRVTDKQALALASATGVSSLWLTLRPVAGAKNSIKLGATVSS